jgi:hypothetical protein
LVLQLKDAEPQMVDEVWEEGAAVVDDEAEDEDEEREECDALDAAADCGNAEEVEEDNI